MQQRQTYRPKSRTRLALAAALAVVAGMAVAADPPKTQASPTAQAVVDFAGKLREAFPLGLWQGRFTEVGKDGKPRLISDAPQCLVAKDREELIAEITDPMIKLAANGKCTHEGSGPGSLALNLRCTSPEGKVLVVETTGSYGPEGMEFRMRLSGEGPEAPPPYEFNARGHRTGDCPPPPNAKPGAKPAP